MSLLGRQRLLLGAVLFWVAAACSLAVRSDELEQGCAPGSKACEVEPGQLSCVSSAEAEFGCGRESCVPCTLPHAVEVCGADGDCAIATCQPGYENCDQVAKNGCEVELESTYDACGSCSNSCEDAVRGMPHALSAECLAGRCEVGVCQEGHADCDGAATNGCETPLSESDCGLCLGCPGRTQCNLETRRCE